MKQEGAPSNDMFWLHDRGLENQGLVQEDLTKNLDLFLRIDRITRDLEWRKVKASLPEPPKFNGN
jgi:hypothetical protein